MIPRPPRSRIPFGRGFSLLELLVVVGLIALLAGGLGIALGDSGGRSLSTAQNTIVSLLGATRAQAAVHQTRARLYVYGTRPPAGEAEKYLRLLQVFREDPARPNNFVASSDPVFLPRGVYVVPPSVTGLLAQGTLWPANPPALSRFATPQPQPLAPRLPAGTPFGGSATGFYLEFAPDGTLTNAGPEGYARVVIASAAVANSLPQFNNPGAVRGAVIRTSGAVTPVNDANAL